MGFGTQASVPERPQLAVLGTVTAVGAFKLSEKTGAAPWKRQFIVSEFEITASPRCPGGRNAKYYFTALPEFFTSDLEPEKYEQSKAIIDGKEKSDPAAFVYRNNIAYQGRAALQALTGCYTAEKTSPAPEGYTTQELGEKSKLALFISPLFVQIGKALEKFTTANPPTLETISSLLSKALLNRTTGYVLRQAKDEDGELRDQYEVSYFFPALKAGVESITKSAKSAKRKQLLLLTWEAPAPATTHSTPQPEPVGAR